MTPRADARQKLVTWTKDHLPNTAADRGFMWRLRAHENAMLNAAIENAIGVFTRIKSGEPVPDDLHAAIRAAILSGSGRP